MMPALKPGRTIEGISAVFLPFTPDGRSDLDGFERHLLRTHRAGLQPAVNMDTGFGPQLSPAERREILKLTRRALGDAPFVAGAMPFGHDGDLLRGYDASIRDILETGGTPIIFPSELFSGDADIVGLYREIVASCPAALAFELGPMFSPVGRVFGTDTYRRLLDIDNVVGLKHSSLSRALEHRRLEIRDSQRPGFRIYTGNDLAIDMVMYGSDYLLGLSTFDPEAFALRDRYWREGDARFHPLNDALQALGVVAFRDPVPAYKDSAAAYLGLTKAMPGARPHPASPRRPAWEAELLKPFADRLAALLQAGPTS